MAEVDTSQYECMIYPIYIDKLHSVNTGRKVPTTAAVEAPTLKEIANALQCLDIKFKAEVEKRHPADFTDGRFRILMKTESGDYQHEEFQSKKSILLAICELIKVERENKAEATPAITEQPITPQLTQTTTQTTTKQNKKKR